MPRKNESLYRIVIGSGATAQVQERMALPSDADARDWLARRWGDTPRARVQKRDFSAEEWKNLPRASPQEAA